jgi:hypothetical protein
MRNTMIRNGLVAALTTAALGAGSTVCFAADATGGPAVTPPQGAAAMASPSAYIKALSFDISKATVTGADVTDEKQVLAQFKALSSKGQEEYLGYLNDPKVVQAFFNSTGEANSDAQTALIAKDATTKYNEDVSFEGGGTVEHESSGTSELSGYATWTDKATYSHKMKVHGITVTKLTVWVRYKATRGAIVSVLNSGSAKINYNLAVLVSSDNARPWVGGNRAHAETVWEGRMTYSLWTAQIDKIQTLSAAWDGTWKGSTKNA